MFRHVREEITEETNAIFRGDLVWLTYGSSSYICLVLDVIGSPYVRDPIRNFKYIVWGDGRIISIQGWHLKKIQ